MNDRTTVWVVGMAMLFGLALPSLAQDAPASDFFETVDVNVVNVEVYVTDKQGNPVPGLTQDDFVLLEDGDPVEISNFYAAHQGKPSETSDFVAEQEVSGDTGSRLEPVIPEDQRLNLVIFIDNNNITPRNRNRVLEALRGSVFFNLNPEDRVLLASFDGSVNVREPLSNDPAALAKALDEIAEGSPKGVHASLNRVSILRQLQQLDLEEDTASQGQAGFQQNFSDSLADSILSEIRSHSQQQFSALERTIHALNGFVDTLSGLSGRKAVIHVSDGLNLRPGEVLFKAWDRKVRELNVQGGLPNVDSEARDFDATGMFEELGRHANANQVTFHTIMAGGRQSLSLTPAERGAFFNSGADAATLGQAWSEGLDSLEKSNFRGSLQIMADATGGQATLSTSAIGSALQRLKKDLDTYYSLGFVARSDNKNHKIAVRLKNPDYKVRHRESYRNLTADEQMTARTRSALLFEVAENPLQVVVGFGDEEKDEKGRVLVPVMVKFPLANVLLLPQEQFHEGKVSIYVAARDTKGGTSPVQKMPAPIRIPNDKLLTALGQVAGFRVTLMMKPGEHSVVVGVRDELANVDSTTRVIHQAGGD